MFICKDCMIRHSWQPSSDPIEGDCELCWERDTQCFEVEKPHKFKISGSAFEAAIIFDEAGKTLDKAEQFEYKRMCDALHVYFERGPQAGQIDYDTTENFLNQITVTVNGDRDWKATYKRRLKAKHSLMKVQERYGGY